MDTDIIEYEPKELVAKETDDPIKEEILEDIEEARATYKSLIAKGKDGLEISYDVMTASEHPRAVEVFANLINSIAGINSKLVDLQTAKREMTKKEERTSPNQPNGVTNNLFVGSPAELLALINGQ